MMDKKILMSLCEDIISMNIDLNMDRWREPTMNPHLKDAINFVRKNSNIKMGMFSNGSMLSKFDLFSTIVKSLSWIRISIDAVPQQVTISFELQTIIIILNSN